MQPSDPMKRVLVGAVIANQSRLRILRSVEADLSQYAPASGTLMQLQQLIDSCHCNYRRFLQELRRPSPCPTIPGLPEASQADPGPTESSRTQHSSSLPQQSLPH